MPWDHEIYSDRLQQYTIAHSVGLCDGIIVRQLLMCTIVVLLRILNEHATLINNDETMHCLVQAFGEGIHSSAGKIYLLTFR